MAHARKRTDVTSVDVQQLGFEYQYLYFMLQLLKLQPGGTVGYEVFDDVYTFSANSNQISYIQVKYTTETAADGSPAGLTRLSIDLWKTLSNWSKVITDPAEERQSEESQLAFLNNASFVLATNRTINTNEVVMKITHFKENKLAIDDFKSYLNGLRNSTTDETIKTLIDDVIALSQNTLLYFIKHVTITCTASDLLSEIRNQIIAKMIPEDYAEDVFNQLYSKMKKDYFTSVSQRQHQIVTFEEWTKQFSSVFNSFRTTLLPLRQYHPLLPEHLEDQWFVKELVEIGAYDLTHDSLADIADLTEYYLSVELQLDDWYTEGRITKDQLERFHREAKLAWKRIHQLSHLTTASDMSRDCSNACVCFFTTLKEKLKLSSTELGLELSNGEFIKLANEKSIGWKFCWQGASK